MTLDTEAVLKAYGLDVALSAEDDADLWAAVLTRYWPAPDHPRLNVKGLRFYVGGELDTPGTADAPRKWVFERVAPNRLRARPVDEFHYRPLPRDSSDRTGYPYRTIGVSEPTRGREKARVLRTFTGGPREGSAKVEVWRRAGDSSWTETDEGFVPWII